jgi:alpha-L-fucosidase
VYAIYLAGEGETTPPPVIEVEGVKPATGARVTLLGGAGDLVWQGAGSGFSVAIPAAVQEAPPCRNAWVVRVDKVERE